MEYKGIEYLRHLLNHKWTRVKTRYEFYEMKDRQKDSGIVIPHHLRAQYNATLGWCAKAVDSLADRLVFKRFANDVFDLNGIFNQNNPDTLFDSAILGALISSCSFGYIAADQDGWPRIQIIDGGNATGIIDPMTGLLSEGYAVLERNKEGKAVVEAYLTAGQTVIYRAGQREPEVYTNAAPYPLLVPIIYRPDAVRPFGHSRISRAAMYWTEYAKRTLERSDVSAEFYSFPQKYVLGTSQDADPLDRWRATISSMLEFTKDDDGDRPTVGQFTQQSMAPYTEQLRTAAAGFAGETGLTLDDLGFVSDNPSSAEAIKASHESLRATARKAQRTFGSGFLNLGYLAACVRDDFSYERRQLYLTTPKWAPVFEPDASALNVIGDGIIKLSQAMPDYVTEDWLDDLTGR